MTLGDSVSSKKALRRSLLIQRQQIPSAQRAAKSTKIVQHLRQSPWFQASKTVFAYRHFRQEVSLSALYHQALQSHHWGFPRCVGQAMIWHQWTGQTAEEFSLSTYGIEEPAMSWPILKQPDLILLPTVACDRRGYRLGYGGGYYDRMLAELAPQTRTIGIVFDPFLIDEIPIDPWDYPLNAICTESGLFQI